MISVYLYPWLESCSKSVTARDLAQMFLRTVFRDQGVPLGILTDMDSRFISEFWQEFFLLLQTDVKITSAYHQQSNGGSEKFNKTLLEALRSYVNVRHDDWSSFLLPFEFTYNNSVSPSTGFSPFMLQFGEQPRGLPDVVGGGVVNSPMAANLVHEIFANVNAARDLLQKQADEFRRVHASRAKAHQYQVGYWVLLSAENIRFRHGIRSYARVLWDLSAFRNYWGQIRLRSRQRVVSGPCLKFRISCIYDPTLVVRWRLGPSRASSRLSQLILMQMAIHGTRRRSCGTRASQTCASRNALCAGEVTTRAMTSGCNGRRSRLML